MQLFIRTIKSEKFLFFLLIISFSLRIYGLNWGIPEPSSEWPLMSYHPDESRILLASSQFPIHIFTSKEFLYPTGLQYFIGILTLPIRLLILLFAGKDGIEMFFPNMLIIGRIFSVICGTLTIFFTYLIGNEIFHKKVGLYASIFLTFYIYHVSHSAFAHLDIPHSLFIALFIFYSIKAIKTKDKNLYILSSILLGIATGIKYSGFAAITFPAIYILLNGLKNKKLFNIDFISQIFFNRVFVKCILFFIFTFLITTPGVLIYPFGFWESIAFEFSRIGDLKNQTTFLSFDFIYGILKSISISSGFPILISFIIGVFISLRTKNYISISLLGYILFYSITVGSSFLPRYILSIAPFICIYAGYFISFILQKNNKNKFFYLIITFLIFSTTISNTVSILWQRYPDTRDLAKEWIKDYISKDKSIGYDYTSYEEGNTDGVSGLLHIWRYPIDEFIYTNWEIKDFLQKPDFIILNSYNLNVVNPLFKENLVDVENNFSLKPLKKNQKYLIKRSRVPEPEILNFYYKLETNNLEDYKLVKLFSPRKNLFSVDISWPSPTIKILKKINTEAF